MTGYGKCPTCGGEHVVLIGVNDPYGHACLHVHGIGSTYLCCCLNCGTLFLPVHVLKILRNKEV